MKLKHFKILSIIWAIVWAIFALIARLSGEELGTVATLGGIALMFAWMYEQENINGRN